MISPRRYQIALISPAEVTAKTTVAKYEVELQKTSQAL
jgi:hypothetical protein